MHLYAIYSAVVGQSRHHYFSKSKSQQLRSNFTSNAEINDEIANLLGLQF